MATGQSRSGETEQSGNGETGQSGNGETRQPGNGEAGDGSPQGPCGQAGSAGGCRGGDSCGSGAKAGVQAGVGVQGGTASARERPVLTGQQQSPGCTQERERSQCSWSPPMGSKRAWATRPLQASRGHPRGQCTSPWRRPGEQRFKSTSTDPASTCV